MSRRITFGENTRIIAAVFGVKVISGHGFRNFSQSQAGADVFFPMAGGPHQRVEPNAGCL